MRNYTLISSCETAILKLYWKDNSITAFPLLVDRQLMMSKIPFLYISRFLIIIVEDKHLGNSDKTF